MVSVCLPSDARLQHLPSYLGFSYLGCGVSLHGCSSKAQPLLLTWDEGYLLTATPSDLEHGIAPLGPSFACAATASCTWGCSSWSSPLTYKCLNPHPSEGRQNEKKKKNKTKKHRKLPILITWITTLSNSVKLWAILHWANPERMGHGEEVWQNMVHWRREWQTTSVFLTWEPHKQYEKAKS